jgi:toxin HigB-1
MEEGNARGRDAPGERFSPSVIVSGLTLVTPCVIIIKMIKTFRDKDTESIFARQFSKKFPANLLTVAWRKLAILDAAEKLDDLRVPPGNRLEKLSGDRAGQYSIRINDQWRICFSWGATGPANVEIVDYH